MIKYLHSTTVLVRDQEAAIDFYVNKLGFELRMDNQFGENGRWLVVAPPDGETGIAILTPEMTGESEDRIGRETGISFIADDVHKTYEELVARGVNVAKPPEKMPWGSMATWFSDPDGNSYFLTEDGPVE